MIVRAGRAAFAASIVFSTCLSACLSAGPTQSTGTGGKTSQPSSGGQTGQGAGGSSTGGSSSGGSTSSGGNLGTGGNGAGGNGNGSGGSGGASSNTGGRLATGGNSGSGGMGGSASGGQSGGNGGTTGDTSCTNGKKDGSETGVDCGGTCPACVNYKINGPKTQNDTKSSCEGGSGYMCTRSMLFSPEFKQAAMDDTNLGDPPFVYGTVGHDADTGGLDNGNTCCQCYQLVFESPRDGVSDVPTPKPMIVQAFNTAAGGGKNFDIYMAAGGYGNFNGCIGGSSPMYSQFPDLGGNYTGGVRATRYSECSTGQKYTQASIATTQCQNYVASQCQMIKASASASNQSTSQISCTEANVPTSLYHTNWNVRAKRVECPVNLTRVTGCKLKSQGLPAADANAKDSATADSSFKTGYTTTTMQDCCRPTCAWPNNVSNAEAPYSLFYTCDKAGAPATQ